MSYYKIAALELNSIVKPYNSIQREDLVEDNITGAVSNTIESKVLEILKGCILALLLGSNFLWKAKQLYVTETIFDHIVDEQTESVIKK